MKKIKIKIIIPYFGKNFPLSIIPFLDSCRHNPRIDFHFFSNICLPISHISNVFYTKCELDDVRCILPSSLTKGLRYPYKLCDYKPLYGVIFQKYLYGYDFWGYCDVDLVFGRIEDYLYSVNIDKYDRLFCFGHLTLYRNNENINYLWQKKADTLTSNFKYVCQTTLSCNFDECGMNQICSRELNNRWLKFVKLLDIDWYFPYFKSTRKDISSFPQLIIHKPDGSLWFYYQNSDREIISEEIHYIHMFHRKFYESNLWDNKIGGIGIPYAITNDGFIKCEDKDIPSMLEKYSYPKLVEIEGRKKEFIHGLRKAKIDKFLREIHILKMRGIINIFIKVLFDKLLLPSEKNRN